MDAFSRDHAFAHGTGYTGIQSGMVFGNLASCVGGIRKPASDHRSGELGLQQPLVLFILSSMFIMDKISIPARRSGVPPTDQSLPGGSASATPPGSAGVPPASFSFWGSLSISATLRAATTLAKTATAKPKENQGAVAGRSKCRSWPRLRQALCGRDARAPRKPSSPVLCNPRRNLTFVIN